MFKSLQTKSFILLLLIAIASTYASLLVTEQVSPNLDAAYYLKKAGTVAMPHRIQGMSALASVEIPEVKEPEPVNTSTWKLHEDTNYDITFRVPESWNVKTTTYSQGAQRLYIIVIKPENSTDNIRIYISDSSFAMKGLRTTKTTVDGLPALSADGQLVEVKKQQNFFTFDLGANLDRKLEFEKILESVRFIQG